MNQKQIGLVIVIFAIALFFLTYSFTNKIVADNKVLHTTCTLPAEVCPFEAYPSQGIFGWTLSSIMFLFGLYLLFSKPVKVIPSGTSRKAEIQSALKELKGDEKKILEIVADEGTIFQSTLVEKSGLSKVKVSRILDTLEGKGLIERKRRGMSNVVILK